MRRFLLLFPTILLSVSAWTQEVTLQGRVVDAKTGEPLPYAAIYVSPGRGTMTNAAGDFRLTASVQDVLTFSFVGYEKQRVKASDVSEEVRLKPFEQQLQEIVVSPVDESYILKQVIQNLKKDYSLHKKDRQGYFMRTLMRNWADTYLIESFMAANSSVNLRDEATFSGIYGKNSSGDSSRMGLNFTNIQHLTEIAPRTNSCPYWNAAIKPLNSVATARKYYNLEVETLIGDEGEKLYCIHFQWNDKHTKNLRGRRYLTGTAFVDARTLRLLRFDGDVGNAFYMYNFIFRQSNAIKFHIDYDYTQGFAAVNNLAVEGGNSWMQYRILMFGIQADSLIAAGGGFADNNIVDAVRNAGCDSTLWEKFNIVKRTAEEECIAFGEQTPPPELSEEEETPNPLEKEMPQKEEIRKDIRCPEAFRPLMERLSAFGSTIPQEKVFIHMDNTSYQLGDTIWFSAYTRQTNTGKPSDISGVLYVELYGQEGYMIERKLIQMKEGRGNGFFALTSQIQYAGFYELRAYTRWQLNWGLFEHKHLNAISSQFASKKQEREYYRDYDKLYSRVFPVYDKPVVPGEFNHDMTLRAMRRLYNSEPERRELRLSLFPEGGNLVAGVENRIAFEAVMSDGEQVEGTLSGSGQAKTIHRGRGLFTIIPEKGMEREVTFVTTDGKKTSAKLPKPEEEGISIKVIQKGDSTFIETSLAGLNADNLALTIMHEGKVEVFHSLSDGQSMRTGGLTAGIHQATVFDTQGRVWADRLFFVTKPELSEPSLTVSGLKDEYSPYEKVELKIKNIPQKGEQGGTFSLSVQDDYQTDPLFDNGNIMTEMLLSSEIKGFIPNPGWYFEKDDEEHRQALDLLMMTQGWRRFVWRDMAVRGAWDLVQPAEKAPILIGNTFKNINTEDMFLDNGDSKREEHEKAEDEEDKSREKRNLYETKPMDLSGFYEGIGTKSPQNKAREETEYKKAVNEKEQNRMNRKELKVHAEIVAVDAEMSFTGEMETDQGAFRIQLPPFYGSSVVFISVADTTKWKEGKPYTWIQAEPDNEDTDYMYLPASRKLRQKILVEPAEYLARISWPYPRFVKPYSFYQNHLAPAQLSRKGDKEVSLHRDSDGATLMREITVKTKRNRLRKFDDTWPILAIDALEANNIAKDYGLGFMQVMVGDYGVGAPNSNGGMKGEQTFETRYGYGRTRRMLMDKEIPVDSIYARKYLISGSFKLTTFETHGGSDEHFQLSPGESTEYRGTGVWDKYVLYSDYSPRMEGNEQYYGANEPKTKLVMYPFPDGSRRITYRDRRYILEGFSYPAEFYSPNYSSQTPPEPTDYRRTLYWNPNLRLDENGEANITFYNNSRPTTLSVEAEGQAADGTLLWSR